MKITVYKSSLCPRCQLVRLYLEQLRSRQPELDIEYIDVLTSPRQTFNAGVRMIPALVAGSHRLSGFHLGFKAIREFIDTICSEEKTAGSTQRNPT
ncbi:MAG: thioredoxin family protein [Desulfopila sp.]